MKYYIFDIKTALTLTDKTDELEFLLVRLISITGITIKMFGKFRETIISTSKFDDGAFYPDELVLVYTGIVDRDLNTYVRQLNEFNAKINSLDIIKNREEYYKFISDIGISTISNVLLGSYKVVEDFDVKIKEAQQQGIINPIAHILAIEGMGKDSIDPTTPYISGFVTTTPETLEELRQESNSIDETTNIDAFNNNDGLFELAPSNVDVGGIYTDFTKVVPVGDIDGDLNVNPNKIVKTINMLGSTLLYKEYTGTFGWDDEANKYHGKLADITDVITFEGKTLDELKQNFVIAVEEYLDFCKDDDKTQQSSSDNNN